ncbi:MAG: hypothetical protein R3B99_32400 [Polyangiales bacterium]
MARHQKVLEGEPMLLGSEGTSRSAVETFAALLPNDEVPAVLVQLDERRAELEDLACSKAKTSMR